MEFPGQLLLRTYRNALLQNSFYGKRETKTIEVKYNEDAHKITSISLFFQQSVLHYVSRNVGQMSEKPRETFGKKFI